MEQLEFEFVARRYDIFSDSVRPVTPADMQVLNQAYWAYGQVRKAASYAAVEGKESLPLIVLQTIHDNLRARLNVPA